MRYGGSLGNASSIRCSLRPRFSRRFGVVNSAPSLDKDVIILFLNFFTCGFFFFFFLIKTCGFIGFPGKLVWFFPLREITHTSEFVWSGGTCTWRVSKRCQKTRGQQWRHRSRCVAPQSHVGPSQNLPDSFSDDSFYRNPTLMSVNHWITT